MVFNFPIMIIASAAIGTRALNSKPCWTCQPKGSYLLYSLQQYRLLWEAAAYLHTFIIPFIIIVDVFVFQNVIIQERNFYVFTIFRDSQLVFVPLKKTIIFRVLCPELFDPYCQLNYYSSGPRFCFDCLYIPIFWNILFNSCSFLTQMWHRHSDTRLWSKSSEIFCCLSLSPFNSVTTWQDEASEFPWWSKFPTCSGSNSQELREIWSCSKWTELEMVSAAGGAAGFEVRLGS